MQQELNDIMIIGKPLYDLEGCLNAYKRPQLLEIAKGYGLRASRLKKDELVQELKKTIVEQLNDELLYLPYEETMHLINAYKGEIDSNDLYLNISLVQFRYKGWVFFFTSREDTETYLIVPKEIKDSISKFVNDKENVSKAVDNNVMNMYLKALVNLYGVVEKDHFIHVWNCNNEKKLTIEKLDEYLKQIINHEGFCWVDGRFIVDSFFDDRDDFGTLLTQVHDKPYFIPTEEAIEIYCENIVNRNTSYYKNVRNFLANKFSDSIKFENLMIELEEACVIESLPSEVLSLVTESSVVFNSSKELDRFIKVFYEWYNHTKKWVNRGFSPAELSNARNKTPTIYTDEPTVKAKKVGRNDPCLCGSKMKYKFCCGRL